MFKMGAVKSITEKCEFQIEVGGNKKIKSDFVVTMRKQSADIIKERHREMNEYVKNLQIHFGRLEKDPFYNEEENPMPEGDFDDKYLLEDIEDIEGLADENGNEIEYNPELLPEILKVSEARTALIKLWGKYNLGSKAQSEKAAKSKN